MKITVLMGSPNRKGSTSILVENFTRGAEEAGHSVEIIDVCHADIHPCIGCVKCGYEGPCVQKDDVQAIRKPIGFRYGCFRDSALLLRNERPAEDSGGSFLCLQQKPEQQASEICSSDSCVER